MDFKIYTIDPKGRQKYGTYVSSQKTTQMVTTNVYNGNDTTTSLDNQNTGPAGIYLNYPFESGGTWWIGDTDTGIPYSPADIINIISGRWFINNTDTGILVAYADGREKYWLLFLDKTVGEVEGSTLATTPQTITVTPIGYTSNQRGAVYVGNLASDSAQTNYCITGLTDSGMTVVVSGNGTTATTIKFTFNQDLTPGVTAGTIQIPCNVYIGSIDADRMGNDYFKWMENAEYVQEAVLTWSWVMNVDSVSLYTMNLTNDSAMVNCDASGNVLTGAVKPSCTIQLFYGDALTSATWYDIEYNSSQAVSGLSVNHSTGVITFDQQTFNFLGTSLEITCKCVPTSSTGWLDQVKIMNITKAFPGADGASGASGANAVSRWISLSADAVSFDSAGTPNPSIIYATCWKQVGEDPVVEDTATTIYYGYGTNYPTNVYSNYVSVDRSQSGSYLTFGLRNAQNRYYELETVAFVRDGLPGPSGETGAPGRQGAAIRGPRKWSDLLQYVCEEDTMRMCNGHYDAQHPEDGQWLDIIIQDMDGTANTIYYCNTSFDMECQEEEEGATWNAYKQNFTSGVNYDFVATNVLLANNASIDFLTNNELYLRNSAGTITAGGAGGNGINFWAGYSSPSTAAPFYVNTQGEMKATKGTFGIFTIGQDDSHRSHDALNAEYVETVNSEPFKMTMTPNQIYMAGYGSTAATDPAQEISITPFRNNEICLPDQDEEWAAIDVRGYDSWSAKTAFHARGKYAETARVANGNTGFISYPSEETETEMWMNLPPCTIPNVVIVPQITATTLATWVALKNFFSSAGTNWKFCGNDLGMRCSVSSYPKIKVVTASDIADSNFKNMPSWMKGHIIFYNDDSHFHDTEWVWSGVAGASADFTQGMLFMRINYNA